MFTRLKASLWPLAYAVLSGGVTGLAYPRFNLWPAIFLGVMGILHLAKGRSLSASAGLGFAAGLGFYMSQIYWISQYLGPVPLIALSTLQALIFAAGMVVLTLTWRLFESTKSILRVLVAPALASVWTAREWVSTHWPYGGFPWSRLGMSQAYSPLAKYAFLGGIQGISFVVALASALLLLVILDLRSSAAVIRNAVLGVVAAALILVVPAAITPSTAAEAGNLKIAAVQGNANAGLFANQVPGSIFEKHLIASSVLVPEGPGMRPDLVIWPENAVDLNPLSHASVATKINDFVNTTDTPLVFGTITESKGKYFNSSLLWLPNRGLSDQYDKKRPVPFAEYVPDRGFWGSLAPDLIGLIWHDYSFGQRDGIFELAKAKLGVNICFEIAVDELNRDLVTDGATVIASQTNNSDFGHSDETYQQVAIAKLRAIETGRAVINDSTVGVTAAFMPDGSEIAKLDPFTPGVLRATLPLRNSKTPAYFVEPILDITFNLIALSIAVLGGFRAVRARRNTKQEDLA